MWLGTGFRGRAIHHHFGIGVSVAQMWLVSERLCEPGVELSYCTKQQVLLRSLLDSFCRLFICEIMPGLSWEQSLYLRPQRLSAAAVRRVIMRTMEDYLHTTTFY
jgi:hypothetical protein